MFAQDHVLEPYCFYRSVVTYMLNVESDMAPTLINTAVKSKYILIYSGHNIKISIMGISEEP